MNKTKQRQLRRRILETLDLSPAQMAAFMWFGSFPNRGPVDLEQVDYLCCMGLIDFKYNPKEGFRVTGDGDYYARYNVKFIQAVMNLTVTTDESPMREEVAKLSRKVMEHVKELAVAS